MVPGPGLHVAEVGGTWRWLEEHMYPWDEREGSMTPQRGGFADAHQLLAISLTPSFKPEPLRAAALPREV